MLYCALNVVIRLILIYVAYVVDNSSDTIKFTDTDYDVFSDAAAHVCQGNSPYLRKTYRYTPLAAYICVINTFIHPLSWFLCQLFYGHKILLRRTRRVAGRNQLTGIVRTIS